MAPGFTCFGDHVCVSGLNWKPICLPSREGKSSLAFSRQGNHSSLSLGKSPTQQDLTQQWYLAMPWEVTSTLAQVHSGSFTASSSPPWRIDQCSATSAFPITRNILLLSSCSWLSCSPFLCIPQRRASDGQWDHKLELQLSIVVLHHGAASSCSSSCLPIPKPII